MSENKMFLEMAKVAAENSKCDKIKVGAVAVNMDNKAVGIGWNHIPKPLTGDCEAEGETRFEVIHAECQAICSAVSKLKGGKLYTTLMPCPECCKIIASAGIEYVYYLKEHDRKQGIDMLIDMGKIVKKIKL